ncbi:hydrolase 2, exosortase A system-associated [Massilia solisilvae]|uniref:Hydrolase 2, exosortase A system-associated n=1 Tax=Massilia solisilvae TaxID=1811225 RepID=A0ABT2BN99_9BURK|nr:hydrolase 2, exosortase A system-associated [Massilia solisilvae]MCS0609988.1 hydrolase 2, exosortase A system-associated [Massilia solisilvae]
MALPGHAPAEPIYLDASAGPRFCLFHHPAGPCRAALVYIHPFAEEMNRARRMSALAARALAASGVAVLQLDLHGCGDSSGEFGDARWDTWKRDVALASAWLRARLGMQPGLWGLRLGALLALDCVQGDALPADRLLLWQPVLSGSGYLTQLLRLRLAGDLLQQDGATTSTGSLRALLRGGSTIEIAGYDLAPGLALPMDQLEAVALAPPRCPVHWFEVVAAPGQPLSPAAGRVASAWRDKGADLHAETVCGPSFWATPEIAECPQLVEATVNACREAAHA